MIRSGFKYWKVLAVQRGRLVWIFFFFLTKVARIENKMAAEWIFSRQSSVSNMAAFLGGI